MSAPAFRRVQREGIEAAKEEAEKHGLTAEVSRHNGKHLILEICNASGERRTFPVSGSPRSGTNANVVRQSVRRAARSLKGETA